MHRKKSHSRARISKCKRAHSEIVPCHLRAANVTLKPSLLRESVWSLLWCIWWTQHLLPSCGNSFKLTIEGWITNKQNKRLQHWKISNLLSLQLPCEFLWWNYLFLFNKNYVQILLYLRCFAVVLFLIYASCLCIKCTLWVYIIHSTGGFVFFFLQKAFCVKQVYVFSAFRMYFQSAALLNFKLPSLVAFLTNHYVNKSFKSQ